MENDLNSKRQGVKSYKNISQEEAYRILEKIYPKKLLPFVDSSDIPNNWLKMHGYAMKRRITK